MKKRLQGVSEIGARLRTTRRQHDYTLLVGHCHSRVCVLSADLKTRPRVSI